MWVWIAQTGVLKTVKCWSCGYSETRDDASFCAACGVSLAGTTVAAAQPETLKTDDSVRKMRETIARLNKEADKRISKWKQV